MEVLYTPEDSADGEIAGDTTIGQPVDRTLGDTFEDPIVVDSGARPTEVRFGIGPTPGAATTFTRDIPGTDTRVAALLRVCPDFRQVTIGAGTLAATIAGATRLPEIRLPLFGAIRDAFVPARPRRLVARGATLDGAGARRDRRRPIPVICSNGRGPTPTPASVTTR